MGCNLPANPCLTAVKETERAFMWSNAQDSMAGWNWNWNRTAKRLRRGKKIENYQTTETPSKHRWSPIRFNTLSWHPTRGSVSWTEFFCEAPRRKPQMFDPTCPMTGRNEVRGQRMWQAFWANALPGKWSNRSSLWASTFGSSVGGIINADRPGNHPWPRSNIQDRTLTPGGTKLGQ